MEKPGQFRAEINSVLIGWSLVGLLLWRLNLRHG
jgi:hypothetical protein